MKIHSGAIKEYTGPALEQLPAAAFHEPFVLRDAGSEWPCCRHDYTQRLQENYGTKMVEVHRTFDRTDVLSVALSHYLAYALKSDEPFPYYLANWQFETEHPELLSDLKPPAKFVSWLDSQAPGLVQPLRWIFVGPANSASALHEDILGSSAWNMLIVGEKVWEFYPPLGQTAYGKSSSSIVEHLHGTPAFYCIQRPGDIVYTPSRWWHAVRNTTYSIAVTGNFINSINGALVLEYIDELDPEHTNMMFQAVKAIVDKQLRYIKK